MHPPLFERAFSLHVLGTALVLGGLFLGGTGCTSSAERAESPFVPADTVASAVDRDSALAVLTALRRTAFDSAFAALDDYALTRYGRTEQMTPAGTTTAVRSYEVRYRPGADDGTVQRRDSVGAFRDGGLFGWAVPNRDPAARPPNVAAQMLPDQPAYVEPRTREAFRYALRADSLRNGTPAYVLTVRARDRGTGREQGVRYARLLIHRPSTQLIGLALVRGDQVLLFGEDSRMSLRLRRAPDGTWVPYLARVRASVHVPFRTPRQFRTVSAFYEYESSPEE
jgi:hypothetical protein